MADAVIKADAKTSEKLFTVSTVCPLTAPVRLGTSVTALLAGERPGMGCLCHHLDRYVLPGRRLQP
jgi:hypothetical protein